MMRIDVCSESNVLFTGSILRIPCEVLCVCLCGSPQKNALKIGCCLCLGKNPCIVRKIPHIEQTSFRTVLDSIVPESDVITGRYVHNDLCGSTCKKCLKFGILLLNSVIKYNRRVSACIFCNCVHKEIARSVRNIKTCQVEKCILLLEIIKIVE